MRQRHQLQREFDVGPEEIQFKQPEHPMEILGDAVAIAAWQIVVPVANTSRSPEIAYQDRVRERSVV